MSDQTSTQSQDYASNPDNASAGTVPGAHYSAEHNGYVKDQPARTFYRSDYRRAAQLLQSFRHVKGDPYTSKGSIAEAVVTGMAQEMAELFAADAPGFDTGKFLAGTMLPPAPESPEGSISTPFGEDTI